LRYIEIGERRERDGWVEKGLGGRERSVSVDKLRRVYGEKRGGEKARKREIIGMGAGGLREGENTYMVWEDIVK
jgi:hypothetical protein